MEAETASLNGSSVDDEDVNVWVQLTSETLGKSTLPPSKILLILGNNETDKGSLIGRLQGKTFRSAGRGMEYSFMSVRDEYCEDQTKLNIWSLDEDAIHCNLLKFVLNTESFENTTILLVISMTKPWEFIDRLSSWASVLEEHISRLGFPENVFEAHKTANARRFREYIEPGFHAPVINDNGIVEREFELKNNLGLDVIVVVEKTEYMKTLVSDMGYENEHFDFVQLQLRKFCLSYGAALIYLSVKEDRNCDLMSRYIMHRIYSFSFRTPAMLMEKESVFVPSGWESEKKIEILANTLLTIDPEAPYHFIISKPSRIFSSQMTQDAVPLNDSDFLYRVQTSLTQPLGDGHADGQTEIQRSSPQMVQRSGQRRANCSPIKKLEPRSQSAEGNTVLQSFFESLLNRKSSTPGQNRSSGEVESSKEALASSGVLSSYSRGKPLHLPLQRDHSVPANYPMDDNLQDDPDSSPPLDDHEAVRTKRSLPLLVSRSSGGEGVTDTNGVSSRSRSSSRASGLPCCQTSGHESRISDLIKCRSHLKHTDRARSNDDGSQMDEDATIECNGKSEKDKSECVVNQTSPTSSGHIEQTKQGST